MDKIKHFIDNFKNKTDKDSALFIELFGDLTEIENPVVEYEPGRRMYIAHKCLSYALRNISYDGSEKNYSYFRLSSGTSSSDVSVDNYEASSVENTYKITFYHKSFMIDEKPIFKYALSLSVLDKVNIKFEHVLENISVNDLIHYFEEFRESFLK